MKSFGNGVRKIQEEIDGIKSILPLLNVDADTGNCTWSVDRNNRTKAGDPAGTKTKKGYTRLQINGKMYFLHRIIFYMCKGYLPQIVDHVKGVENGNGIANLQEATNTENSRKKKTPSHNTSGYKGVYWNDRDQKWYAQIKFDGKRKHIGYYDDINDANDAYQLAAKQIFGKLFNKSP